MKKILPIILAFFATQVLAQSYPSPIYNNLSVNGNASFANAIPLTSGGTGANTASAALANLGGFPISGGTLTGPLTVPSLSVTGTPIAIASGGTNCVTASGTCLDNIAGFASTGFLERTGSGAYTFVADPLPVAHGGTGSATATGAASQFQYQALGTGGIARTYQVKFGDTINAADYGVACDGSTADATNLNKALTYAGTVAPAVVMLPNMITSCQIGATVTIPAGVTLKGNGGWSAGLNASALNLNPMVQLAGNDSTIREIYVRADALGANTSGAVIAMANTGHPQVDNVYVQGGCIAIDMNGNQPLLSNSVINGVQGTGCSSIRVGNLTTNAGTVDPRIINVTASANQSTPPDADLLVLDAGGLIVTGSDMLFSKVGTSILPGTNQWVNWASLDNTYVGDTNTQYALKIDTVTSTSKVQGLQCSSCWASSATTANILIQNTGAGKVAGIHFAGLRNYNSAGNGANLSAGSDITFDASHFCGNGTGNSNIFIGGTIAGFAVRSSELGAGCGGIFSTTPTYALLFGATTSNAVVTGNDLSGPTNAIGGNPSGNSVVRDNIGLDTGPGTAASAATLNVGMQTVTQVTGTTGVSTISPTWNGRTLQLITTGGAISFATGGNICAAFTSIQNVPISAYYNGSCWYLK